VLYAREADAVCQDGDSPGLVELSRSDKRHDLEVVPTLSVSQGVAYWLSRDMWSIQRPKQGRSVCKFQQTRKVELSSTIVLHHTSSTFYSLFLYVVPMLLLILQQPILDHVANYNKPWWFFLEFCIQVLWEGGLVRILIYGFTASFNSVLPLGNYQA
jgi:hypothetical protein